MACARSGAEHTSLFHKTYQCQALRVIRENNASTELQAAAAAVHATGNATLERAFCRGTLPDPTVLLPPPKNMATAEVLWHNRPFDGVLRGNCFFDGSAFQGGTAASVAGWAIGQADSSGHIQSAV